MPPTRISYAAALILHALESGCVYGFDVMETTGLPSGTVYPALRRMEKSGLVRSNWENADAAHAEGRPRRRNYRLTASGVDALAAARERLPLLPAASVIAPAEG